jgi:hypothetical protein
LVKIIQGVPRLVQFHLDKYDLKLYEKSANPQGVKVPPGFGLISDGFKKDASLKAQNDGLVYSGGVMKEDSEES